MESAERQGDDLKQEAAPHCTYEPGGVKRLRALRSVTARDGWNRLLTGVWGSERRKQELMSSMKGRWRAAGDGAKEAREGGEGRGLRGPATWKKRQRGGGGDRERIRSEPPRSALHLMTFGFYIRSIHY